MEDYTTKLYDFLYHPKKPKGIETSKAHIVGGGIAGLAAAAFLVDDAGMPGENITIYEKRQDVGGCCGVIGTDGAYVCPGERELEPHMECLWYLCSKIPSLDTPGRTVLDETVDVNRELPIHSECRAIQNQGHIWEGIHDYRMGPETTEKLQKFITEPTDRPKIIPKSSSNLAFIGQFVELEGDVVFTVETSVRTAMTAVYKMLHLDRPITPLFKGQYDIRMVNIALKILIGKDKIEVSDLPKINPLKIRSMLKQFVDFINSIPPVPEYYSERYENN